MILVTIQTKVSW